MALASGTKLGPYEIVSPLGAGGMGEVYRAKDTRLNRVVAIKILPSHVSSDSGRRARFEREARVISSLSHPNICALFDIGDQDGVQYLVLEYLEGQTLAERLAKGPLPISEVLKAGAEIAFALETAHRHGIIHRDLKPGNVILTKTGAKLLDFGLAKSQPAWIASAAAEEPTLSKSLTEEGIVVGTFRYMAPEQLEGKEADSRTDIFALGALLYETCTGRSAFSGSSRASITTAIMSGEPTPIRLLQPLSPPSFERVVQTCLAKNPDDRWQTAHDVRLQVEWIRDAGLQAGIVRVNGKGRITREWIAWVTAGLLVLAIATISAVHFFRRPSQGQPQLIFSVEPAPGYKPTGDGMTSLSTDGGQLVYAAVDDKQKSSLWVRSLDSLAARRLEGSESDEGYLAVAWSPNSKAVIAVVNGKLVRFSLTGGANEVMCDRFTALPMTINGEGTILTWTAPPTKIFSVSADDCALRERSPSGGGSDIGYAYPHFLPDGNRFLFAAIHKDKHHEVLLSSLSNPKPRVLIRNGSYPKYISAGYILFSRDGYLMAQEFDAKTEAIRGEPFLVYPNQLSFYAAFGWAAFDASSAGLISGHEQREPPRLLRWYDRSGRLLKTLGVPEYVGDARLDAHGTHALVSSYNPRTHASDIWSVDLQSGARHRESFHDRPGNQGGLFTLDGRRIVYSTLQGSEFAMFIKDIGNSGNGEVIQTGLSGSTFIADASPDGSSILFQRQRAAGASPETYGQSLVAGKPFLIGPAVEDELPRLSPDGHWVALPSDESGSVEIVVRPFSSVASAGIQVSFGGAHDPRWSRDGRELYYRTNDWHIVAVPVLDVSRQRFGKPVTLFRLSEGAQYDVMDGKHFLVSEPVEPTLASPFVIANWRPAPPALH